MGAPANRSTNGNGGMLPRPGGSLWVAGAVLLFVAAVLLVGAVWAWRMAGPWRWLMIAGLMVGLLMTIGYRVNRRVDGILIDGRYKISLSRLQITLWTVLVLSALLTIALPRSLPGGLLDLTAVDAQTRAELQQLSPDRAECFAEADALPPGCDPDPVQIVFPTELLIALGISGASLAGSTLIKSVKRNQEVDLTLIKEVHVGRMAVQRAEAALEEAQEIYDEATSRLHHEVQRVVEIERGLAAATGEESRAQMETQLGSARKSRDMASFIFADAEQEMNAAQEEYEEAQQQLELLEGEAEEESEGALHRNADPRQADWIDLFRGDEIGNYKLVDISKVQMFFFTIVLIFAYAAAIQQLLLNSTALQNPLGVHLPLFSASMNGLLGISHAGYLTVKSVDRTRTAQ